MNNLLITGFPGVGKTTVIARISDALKELHPTGFITREMREAGTRVGFEVVGCDGSRRLLSHMDIGSRHRVGKYSVDVEGFEEYLYSLDIERTVKNLVILDEIGKMECYSPLFRNLVVRLLESDRIVVATIARKGTLFIEKMKQRRDIVLIEVTRENRDRLPGEIVMIIHRWLEHFDERDQTFQADELKKCYID